MQYHIIDGNYQVNRSVYADKENLSTVDTDSGETVYTGGAYYYLRMINMIKKELSTIKNEHIIVVFDGDRRCKRRLDLYPDYKKRKVKEMTEAQQEQKKLDELKFKTTFSILKELLPAMGVTVISHTDMEADDVIYALTRDNEHTYKVYSDDEDYLQMIKGNVKVFKLIKGVLYTEDVFKEEYGYHHSFLPLYKSLLGDPSDNISGVKGVGKVRAATIVKDLDKKFGIYEPGFEVSELEKLVEHETAKWASTLVAGLPIVERNLQLIDLNNISEDIHDFARKSFEERGSESSLVESKQMLKYYGFKSLYSLIAELM